MHAAIELLEIANQLETFQSAISEWIEQSNFDVWRSGQCYHSIVGIAEIQIV